MGCNILGAYIVPPFLMGKLLRKRQIFNVDVKEILEQVYDNFLRVARRKSKDKTLDFPAIGFLSEKKKNTLEQRLGVSVGNIAIFEQALAHRSALQSLPNGILSNERLEFLGDAILGMVVAEYLFYHYRDNQEGDLTKMRSWLVNKRSLALCARSLCLEEFILASVSAKQSIQKGNEAILADALEAIIAAIYIDSGIKAARNFILRILIPILNVVPPHNANYKGRLLEIVQARGHEAPYYVVRAESGPAHEPVFTVAVMLQGEEIGIGTSKTKKEAEQIAARSALETKFPNS